MWLTNNVRHYASLLTGIALFHATSAAAQSYGSNATAAATKTKATASTIATDGITLVNPTGYSTKTYNASGAYSTYLPNNDFSDERLNFLWDQVFRTTTLLSVPH